jgi:hypothetical protein
MLWLSIFSYWWKNYKSQCKKLSVHVETSFSQTGRFYLSVSFWKAVLRIRDPVLFYPLGPVWNCFGSQIPAPAPFFGEIFLYYLQNLCNTTVYLWNWATLKTYSWNLKKQEKRMFSLLPLFKKDWGSGIWDPGSGSGIKKFSDPGFGIKDLGSATLLESVLITRVLVT